MPPGRPAPDPPPAAPSLRTLATQSWHVFHPVPALYCLPAVVAVLLTGLLLRQPAAAVLATGGAFSVGFGAFQRVGRLHVAPMLLAALAMAVSTAVGTVAANDAYADAACVTVAGFVLGLGTGFGTGPWWVLLQGAIFLVVAGSVPGGVQEGLARAALVAGGGAVQTLSVAILRTAIPAGFPPLSSPVATPHPDTLAAWQATARRVVSSEAPEWRYGALLGLAAGFAILLERRLAMPNGYWVAMTVLLVLRRGGAETVTRAVLRIAGTLIGAGAATLVVALARPEPLALAPLIALAAWGAYALQWVNYGTFSICVTSYIAFLLSLLGLPETFVATHRIEATLMGGAIGMAAFGVARVWRRALRPLARGA
jgi:hypothetical protein